MINELEGGEGEDTAEDILYFGAVKSVNKDKVIRRSSGAAS